MRTKLLSIFSSTRLSCVVNKYRNVIISRFYGNYIIKSPTLWNTTIHFRLIWDIFLAVFWDNHRFKTICPTLFIAYPRMPFLFNLRKVNQYSRCQMSKALLEMGKKNRKWIFYFQCIQVLLEISVCICENSVDSGRNYISIL